jgi:hypothetical protein
MSIELVVWGILPLMVGLATLVASGMAVLRNPALGQLLISLGLLVAIGWASLILRRMIAGAWPTFIPHYVIGWCVPIAVGQLLLSRRRPGA